MKHRKMKEPAYQPLTTEDKDEDKLEVESSNLFGNWDGIDIITCALKIFLWLSLWALFIELEFGAVFFILSIFYLMFTNFSKSKKVSGQLSAYSVFNPNCEAINGTLTGQQMENEIKFGIGGLH